MIFEKICVQYRVATITAGMQSSSLKQARSRQRSSATVAQLDVIRLGEFHHKVYSVMGSWKTQNTKVSKYLTQKNQQSFKNRPNKWLKISLGEIGSVLFRSLWTWEITSETRQKTSTWSWKKREWSSPKTSRYGTWRGGNVSNRLFVFGCGKTWWETFWMCNWDMSNIF